MSAPQRPDLREDEAELAPSSLAMRKSQASAMTAPAPTAVPLTAAMTGRRSSRMFAMSAPVTRVKASEALHVAREELADDVLDVAAGAERAALAGDDDGAHVVVVIERGERRREALRRPRT